MTQTQLVARGSVGTYSGFRAIVQDVHTSGVLAGMLTVRMFRDNGTISGDVCVSLSEFKAS